MQEIMRRNSLKMIPWKDWGFHFVGVLAETLLRCLRGTKHAVLCDERATRECLALYLRVNLRSWITTYDYTKMWVQSNVEMRMSQRRIIYCSPKMRFCSGRWQLVVNVTLGLSFKRSKLSCRSLVTLKNNEMEVENWNKLRSQWSLAYHPPSFWLFRFWIVPMLVQH